jgi:hypothetical protein
MEVVPNRPSGARSGHRRGPGNWEVPQCRPEADQRRSERRRQRGGGSRVPGTTKGHLTRGSRGYSCRSTGLRLLLWTAGRDASSAAPGIKLDGAGALGGASCRRWRAAAAGEGPGHDRASFAGNRPSCPTTCSGFSRCCSSRARRRGRGAGPSGRRRARACGTAARSAPRRRRRRRPGPSRASRLQARRAAGGWRSWRGSRSASLCSRSSPGIGGLLGPELRRRSGHR